MKLRSGKQTMEGKTPTAGTSGNVNQTGDTTTTRTADHDMFEKMFNFMTKNAEDLDQSMKEVHRKLDENYGKMNENLNEVKEDLRRLEATMEKMQEEVGQEIDTRMASLRQEMSTEMQEEVVTLVASGLNEQKEKLTEHEQKLKEHEQKIQQNERLIRIIPTTPTTYTQPQTYATLDLQFYADARIHPKIFMARTKQYIQTLPPSTQIKHIIQNMLRGDAELWYQMVEDKYESLEEFEGLFFKQYWGEFHQQRVRLNLFNGRYNENYGVSRERYVMKKVYNIRYLEPRFTEAEMVRYLARHFRDDVHSVIITQRITTLDALIEYLRGIDEHRNGWRKPSPREQRREDRQEVRQESYQQGRYNDRSNNNQSPGNELQQI